MNLYQVYLFQCTWFSFWNDFITVRQTYLLLVQFLEASMSDSEGGDPMPKDKSKGLPGTQMEATHKDRDASSAENP